MLKIILILVLGMVCGYLMRKQENLKKINLLIFPIILFMLFSIGVTIGMNEHLLNNLHALSTEALIITGTILAFTIIGAFLLWHTFLKHKVKP